MVAYSRLTSTSATSTDIVGGWYTRAGIGSLCKCSRCLHIRLARQDEPQRDLRRRVESEKQQLQRVENPDRFLECVRIAVIMRYRALIRVGIGLQAR
jgi:hypothetical protein